MEFINLNKDSSHDPLPKIMNTNKDGYHNPTMVIMNSSAYNQGWFQSPNHHQFINKADIKYNGNLFNFYNKLLAFGSQYGIYLLPLNEL